MSETTPPRGTARYANVERIAILCAAIKETALEQLDTGKLIGCRMHLEKAAEALGLIPEESP